MVEATFLDKVELFELKSSSDLLLEPGLLLEDVARESGLVRIRELMSLFKFSQYSSMSNNERDERGPCDLTWRIID